MKYLGFGAEDKITGFKGVITGFCCYLTGCNQYLLQPRIGADGKLEESRWFDEQRLDISLGMKPLKLDNSAALGADKPAPSY